MILKTTVIEYAKISSMLLLLLSFSNSCSEIGRQPPEWASGVFTPNGKYFVYLYKIFNVTYYERAGGMEHRSGKTTYYLQAIDCTTGKKKFSSPIPFENHTDIIEVDDKYIWIETQDESEKKKMTDVIVYDLESNSMKFKRGQLRALNPKVPLQSNSFYINETGQRGLVLQAADGRSYLINPETGKFMRMDFEQLERLVNKNSDTYQLSNHTKRVHFQGSPRAKIKIKDKSKNLTAESVDDYLKPQIVTAAKRYPSDKREETSYHNSFFIFEPTLTNSDNEHIISRIDYTNLAPLWRTTVVQNLSDRDGLVRDKFRFHFQGDQLYVSNAKTLYVIHAGTGEIRSEVALFE